MLPPTVFEVIEESVCEADKLIKVFFKVLSFGGNILGIRYLHFQFVNFNFYLILYIAVSLDKDFALKLITVLV